MSKEKAVNPRALPITEVARLLEVDSALVEADVADGLPLNDDGTVDLLVYAAWLNGARANGEG